MLLRFRTSAWETPNAANAAHVQQVMKNTVTISYRNSNLWCNLVHRFPTVTSHYLQLHLLTLMDDHYADCRQHSRVHYGSTKSHTWDSVICPSPCVCCNMVNISAGDFCSKTQNLISVRCSVTDIFQLRRYLTYTKETNNYHYAFRGYEMSKLFLRWRYEWCQLRQNFLHAAILINYTGEFRQTVKLPGTSTPLRSNMKISFAEYTHHDLGVSSGTTTWQNEWSSDLEITYICQVRGCKLTKSYIHVFFACFVPTWCLRQ